MAKTLTADSTANNVDNPLEITFADDAAWQSKITSVEVDGIPLAAGEYSLSTGKITIDQGIIQVADSYTISVYATGYQVSTVTQAVAAGTASETKTATSMNSDTNSDGNNFTEVTLTAKDQYGNLVSGYQFKYDVTVVQGDGFQDTYMVDGLPVTTDMSATDFQQVTDANGQVKLLIIYADTMSNDDNLTFNIYLNDGTTVVPLLN